MGGAGRANDGWGLPTTSPWGSFPDGGLEPGEASGMDRHATGCLQDTSARGQNLCTDRQLNEERAGGKGQPSGRAPHLAWWSSKWKMHLYPWGQAWTPDSPQQVLMVFPCPSTPWGPLPAPSELQAPLVKTGGLGRSLGC